MSTNRDVVKAALQMLTVLDADENPSAEDSALGLRQLNNLAAILLGEGIDLGFPPQDDVSEVFPLDSTSEAQIEPLLALKLHPFYPSTPLPPEVQGLAAASMQQLKRAAVLANMEESSVKHAPLGERRGGIWDINTDEIG